jgi:rfaE bifunctional protein kinase chain/domain
VSARTSPARLLRLIAKFPRLRLTVAGDLVADEFIYGQIDRVSREAPVLILKYDSTEVVPGGAGNAANNAASLGARVNLLGAIGPDAAGDRLLAALGRGVRTSNILRVKGRVTPVKTRILAGGVHSAKQQVVRIDRGVGRPVPAAARAAFERAAVAAVKTADAVLVSDYGSGLVSPSLVTALRRALSGARRPVPVLVDSRYQLLQYRGLTACTPNESEVEQALGVHIDDNPRVLERSGRAILARTRAEAVLITRGSRGMALFVRKAPTVHIPIFGSDEIADVTGAGDTVVATMTLALAAGASFESAARLANYAGGLVVMKRGTATISAGELRAAIQSDTTRTRGRG